MINARLNITNQLSRRLGTEYLAIPALPPELIDLIVEYWHHLPESLRCPVSDENLNFTVVILHPRVLPILYNIHSVINAVVAGELRHLGINASNVHDHILRQPGINFNTLNGIASVVTSNSSHLSLTFEIENERRRRGDILRPLFLSNAIMVRIPEPNRPLIRDRFLPGIPTPRMYRNRLVALYSKLTLIPTMLSPLIKPVCYGVFFIRQGITLKSLEISSLCIQETFIQYRGLQYARNYQNNFFHIHKLNLIRNILKSAIVVEAVANNMFTVPPYLVPDPPNRRLIGIMQGLIASLPLIVASDTMLQDYLCKRSRRQIKSLKIFVPLALGMLANTIYNFEVKDALFNAKLNLALAAVTQILQLPYLYLSVRETTNTLANAKEYITSPRRLLQNPSIPFAESTESIFSFAARNLLRVLASLSAGFLVYASTENLLAAILTYYAVYMQGSLMYGIGTTDNRYRLLSRPAVPAPINNNLAPLSNITVTSIHIEEEENKEEATLDLFSEYKEEKRPSSRDIDDGLEMPLLSKRSSL